MTAAAPTSFWRKEPPELVDGTVTVGGMFDHQRRWWELPNHVRVLVAGYGSGKSQVLCKRMLALSLENSGIPCAIVSPTFSMARDTVTRTLIEQLEGKQKLYGKRRFAWSLNKTANVFDIKLGSRRGILQVYSGQDPDRLRGSNLAAAGLDEFALMDQGVFDQMTARVRDPRAKRREINLVGTPDGGLSWAYDLCSGDTEHDVGFVRASTRDNKALPESYVARLLATLDDRAAMAYVDGEFVHLDSGLVYHAFNPHEHVRDVKLPERFSPEQSFERPYLAAGCDFNVSPMSFCVGFIDGGDAHILAEYEQPNSDTEQMCSVLKDEWWDLGLRVITPDASGISRSTKSPGGRSDHSMIEEAGFEIHCRSQNPKVRDRYNSVNGMFRHGRLTISPRCKKLIKYLQTYSHENRNKAIGIRASHLLDAFSYLIAHAFPANRELFTNDPLNA